MIAVPMRPASRKGAVWCDMGCGWHGLGHDGVSVDVWWPDGRTGDERHGIWWQS